MSKEFDVRFLIDTDSESNLMRRWISRKNRNMERKQLLKGTGHEMSSTLGITDLIIFGIRSEFQVVHLMIHRYHAKQFWEQDICRILRQLLNLRVQRY